MTKLQQWTFVLTLFTAVYFTILMDVFQLNLSSKTKLFFQLSPGFIIAAFGVYSVVTILYRVATFNNCEDAALELKEQINQARNDLKKKGFKFE